MGRVEQLVYTSLTLLSLNGVADAFWRLPCRGRVALGQMDPIVDVGEIASHVHTMHGGNKLGMANTPQDLVSSDCTSCGVKQDKSAYWTPALYFLHENGTAELPNQPGGMLSYYLLYSNADEKIVQFPPGFQMIAGDTYRRNFTCKVPEPPKSSWSGYETSQAGLAQKAVGFNCLNYPANNLPPGTPGYRAAEASLGRHYLPSKKFLDQNCASGIRLELFFPSCWDGKHATSPDHKSHVAYPSLVNGGECPPGYPKRLPSLFFETIWDTQVFKDVPGQFVLSNGDPTGFGYHGDFQFAWEDDVLQQAIDTCTDPSGDVEACPIFDLIDQDTMQQCKAPIPNAIKHIDCEAHHGGLPGHNPITPGPEPAPKHPEKLPEKAPHKQVEDAANKKTYAQPNPPPKPTKVVDEKGGGKVFANAAPTNDVKPQPKPAGQPAPPSYGGDQIVQAQAMPDSHPAHPHPHPQAHQPPPPPAHAAPPPAPPAYQQNIPKPQQADSAPKAVSTEWVTKGNEVWKITVVETPKIVTVPPPAYTGAAPAAPHYKRHLHEHAHRHAHAHAHH